MIGRPQLVECAMTKFETRVDDPQTSSVVFYDVGKVIERPVWKVYAIEKPLLELGEVARVNFACGSLSTAAVRLPRYRQSVRGEACRTRRCCAKRFQHA